MCKVGGSHLKVFWPGVSWPVASLILFCFLLVSADTFLIFWVALGHLVGTFCFLLIVRGLLVAFFILFGSSGGHFGDHFGTLGDIFGLLGASLVAFRGLLGRPWGHFCRHWGHLGRHGRPKSKNRPGDPKFGPHFGMILGRFGGSKPHPKIIKQTVCQKW